MFEFDPNKSRSNLEKHGIDFNVIQNLWQDPNLIEIPTRYVQEKRSVFIGRLNGKFWSVVVTVRGKKKRIISARRSRKSEVVIYEKNNRE
jgi:uncharacterized DUF497 family protein